MYRSSRVVRKRTTTAAIAVSARLLSTQACHPPTPPYFCSTTVDPLNKEKQQTYNNFSGCRMRHVRAACYDPQKKEKVKRRLVASLPALSLNQLGTYPISLGMEAMQIYIWYVHKQDGLATTKNNRGSTWPRSQKRERVGELSDD